jgi:hypothetical protein
MEVKPFENLELDITNELATTDLEDVANELRARNRGEKEESPNVQDNTEEPNEKPLPLLKDELKTPEFSLSVLYKDFFSDYLLSNELPQDVIDIVRVPWYIETFVLFGQTFCLDAFLGAVVIFPIRAILGGILLILSYLTKLLRLKKTISPPSPSLIFDFICGICLVFSAIIYVNSGAYAITTWLGAKSALRLSAIFTACTVVDSLCGKYETDVANAVLYYLNTSSVPMKGAHIFLIILLTFTICM